MKVVPTRLSAGSQDDIVAALSNPGFYPHGPSTVEHVQTHISHVFLAGAFVYKLKKAVRLPFADFSTLELRHAFCDEEVRLNRRLAPEVYLGVARLTRSRDGGLELDGAGDTIDYVVWMRRLPAERVLAALLDANAVRADMLEQLADLLARFHAAAPTGDAIAMHAAPAAIGATWEQTLALAAPLIGTVVAPEVHAILSSLGPGFLARHETLFRERQGAGRIREGHGDLHAEHVYFVDAPVAAPGLAPLAPGVQVVDCLEFSLPLRCTDVASEIAFTMMDLERRGRRDLAHDFVRRYVALTHDASLAALLPFYACYRACVRGAVEGIKSDEPEVPIADRDAARERARGYLALAFRYAWHTEGPALVACAGLSGTGKSALANGLAEATGYVHLSSDRLRKRRPHRGTPATGPHGEASYTPEARTAVYHELGDEAARALRSGRGVIADATFLRRVDRARLARVAADCGRRHVFVECCAPEELVRARLDARRDSVSESDARWQTYLGQRGEREPFGPDESRFVIETESDLQTTRRRVLEQLWHWYAEPPA